jgi:hypothetical protein
MTDLLFYVFHINLTELYMLALKSVLESFHYFSKSFDL